MIANILHSEFKNDRISKLEENQADMSIEFISDRQKFISFSMDKQLNKKDYPNGLFPFFNSGMQGVCSFCDYIANFL